jgi:hypothetical protein
MVLATSSFSLVDGEVEIATDWKVPFGVLLRGKRKGSSSQQWLEKGTHKHARSCSGGYRLAVIKCETRLPEWN